VPTIAVVGDSISYGVGEGVAGSGSNGDTLGDALGNAGFISRGIFENVGYNEVNLSRGSDGNKYLQTASNWTYRKELMVLANPSYVINENIHNDIASLPTTANWAASTAYSQDAVVLRLGNFYLATTGGTSGSTGPTGTGSSITDGAVTGAWIAADPGSSGRPAYNVFGEIANVNAQIKAALPGIKIIQMLATPTDNSSDAFETTANQTLQSGWGTATSSRGLLDAQIRAKNPLLNISAVIDPNVYLEYNWPTSETSEWLVNGTANYMTYDGTHPNSTGAMLAAPSITSSLFQ
jgi:lysophospholipase L1-like esterase